MYRLIRPLLRELKDNIKKEIVRQETILNYLTEEERDNSKEYHQGCLDTLNKILEDIEECILIL